MTNWVHLDPSELDLQEKRVIQGAPVTMTPSLYDVPEAYLYTRLPSGLFELRFRYLTSGEPVDQYPFGLFDLFLGHNSKRLYRLVGFCGEHETQGCIREVLTHLKSRNPRREGNYSTIAVIIHRYFEPAYTAPAHCFQEKLGDGTSS